MWVFLKIWLNTELDTPYVSKNVKTIESYTSRVMQIQHAVNLEHEQHENAWALTPLPRHALLVTIFARKTF